jgi:hypothetical protein
MHHVEESREEMLDKSYEDTPIVMQSGIEENEVQAS